MRMHFNFTVATEHIYKGEHRVTSSSVDQHVNVKQEKVICHTYFIELQMLMQQ